MQLFFSVGVRREKDGIGASPRSLHRLCLVMYTQRDARSARSARLVPPSEPEVGFDVGRVREKLSQPNREVVDDFHPPGSV